MESRQSRALLKCRVPLVDTLKDDVQHVANSLCRYKMVLHQELNLSKTKSVKAEKLMDAVENQVQQDHTFFDKFLSILQGSPHFKGIVVKLQECLEDSGNFELATASQEEKLL